MNRDCHGQPWGFPGKPAPVPAKTHTRSHGCGFSRVRVWVFVKPTGSNHDNITSALSDVSLALHILQPLALQQQQRTTTNNDEHPNNSEGEAGEAR
jgi:hypothetical protein